jgi:hypothetical protein
MDLRVMAIVFASVFVAGFFVIGLWTLLRA